MSDDKSKVTDKAGEIAKNIWLAGVGAYGRAVDEAQDSLRKATPQTPKLFRDLVKAGAELEEEAREARAAAKSSVEERIARVRENFHQQRPARIEDLDGLHRKIDKLTRKVDALARLLEDGGTPAKPTRPKTRAKKAATAGKKTTATRKAVTRARSTTTTRKG